MSQHHTTNEDEYFAREDAEKKRKLAADAREAMATAERERLKALHHGFCPACGMTLSTLALRGVEVDKCFSCGGTWLDAGELEQLMHDEKREGVMKAILNWFKPNERI